MKTVITYGTFDILHSGHINLLRRAKALGDRLVVGLSSDEFNAGKHKSSLLKPQVGARVDPLCRPRIS
jgi:glycerol-3-phosphate cytidylyltransferase